MAWCLLVFTVTHSGTVFVFVSPFCNPRGTQKTYLSYWTVAVYFSFLFLVFITVTFTKLTFRNGIVDHSLFGFPGVTLFCFLFLFSLPVFSFQAELGSAYLLDGWIGSLVEEGSQKKPVLPKHVHGGKGRRDED
ncbi:hypothetical protein QBC44DRAFT_43223 [Cladorrhinum sp. PSN332]|nr:hypothetical protein QBC44DRAFT_43223 [Cladorrhinum sp. PSN332]